MLSSRKLTLSFVGTFLIGAAAGALLMWDLTDTQLARFMNKTNDSETMQSRINQRYAKDYQLTPEQQAKIAPLVNEMSQHLTQVRRQFAVDILGTLDDYHQKIGQQMTPDQRAAYDKSNAARKQRLSALLLIDPTAASAGQK
jgi:hypothetical protein